MKAPAEASDGLRGFLDKNLWAIMAAGMALYGGYLTGQATTNAEIDQLRRDVDRHDRQLTDRRQFMSCAVRNIDRIMDKTETQQACPLVISD